MMREAGRIVAIVLNTLEDSIRPGVTTWDLDIVAESVTAKLGGIPAFKGYQGFPASICASVNEELVHGIPSASRVLDEGDIVTIDFGASYRGYFGDSAMTYTVGTVSETAKRLLQVTQESLGGAIEQAHAGRHVSDLSKVCPIARRGEWILGRSPIRWPRHWRAYARRAVYPKLL